MTLIINHDESDGKKSRMNFSINIPPKILKTRPSKGSRSDGYWSAEKRKRRKKVVTTYFHSVGSVPSKKTE